MREFLKEDLVDELYLGIVPVLVGEGIPLFAPGFPQREFTLTESKTYSGSLIALKYERMRGKAAVSKRQELAGLPSGPGRIGESRSTDRYFGGYRAYQALRRADCLTESGS